MQILDFKVAAKSFFTSKEVISALDKATRKVLIKFGAFVMTTARQSIRKHGKDAQGNEKTSPPGHAPYSHTGVLKRGILFGYDILWHSVVIGPTLAPNRRMARTPPRLEYGASKIGESWGNRPAYLRRPYMKPALDKNLPVLPAMWHNSIK